MGPPPRYSGDVWGGPAAARAEAEAAEARVVRHPLRGGPVRWVPLEYEHWENPVARHAVGRVWESMRVSCYSDSENVDE